MPKSILVVDDDHLGTELVKRSLEKEGYAIHVATNGVEAFDHLKNHKPDLIILDVQMPQMNGYSFVQEKAKMEEYKSIPVVMLTAAKETAPLFKRYGVKGYLVKPLNLAEMLAKITEVIGPAAA